MEGEDWDRLRAARHSGQTNLQAAETYGPSSKGLQWVVAREHGAFVPSEQIMAAVEAFDSEVMSVLPLRLLVLGGAEVSVEEVRAMHKAWNTEAVIAAERYRLPGRRPKPAGDAGGDAVHASRPWPLPAGNHEPRVFGSGHFRRSRVIGRDGRCGPKQQKDERLKALVPSPRSLAGCCFRLQGMKFVEARVDGRLNPSGH